MPLAIKLGSSLGIGSRPGGVRFGGGVKPVSTSAFSRPNQDKGSPRAQNFSVTKLGQLKERERAKVSISRVVAERKVGSVDSPRVGVGERKTATDSYADKRAEELEIIRQKSIERQKFVTTRRMVRERLAREVEEAKKVAEEKAQRQRTSIF